MSDRWTVWVLTSTQDGWARDAADSEGRAVFLKRMYLRGGARCVVLVAPDGRVTDCERAAEGASLDEVLGRGRHGGPPDDGPTAA